ncbi:MAG TPA: hypothetical protein VF504_02175 [Solirubrobacterales bacterium]
MSSGSAAARSNVVRGTVVTGIPSSTVCSSAGSALWWRRIPSHERLLCGLVTSVTERSLGRIIQSAAADQ